MIVDLNGKVALVTGSSRGIGKAIALIFAKNGADVVVSDIREGSSVVEEINALGRKSLFIDADVSDSQQVDNMMTQIVKKFGTIDILVNNAGIAVGGSDRAPIQDFKEDIWNRVIDIDLKGVFLCSKAAAKYMTKQKRGKIVNVGSVAGIVPLRLQSAYVAAKAGVLNLTRSMALELAPHGINVNAIAPGSIVTEMTEPLFYLPGKAQYSEKTLDLISHIPLGRPGKTEDIANVALFLASSETDYVTGSIFVVDGGWTAGYLRNW